MKIEAGFFLGPSHSGIDFNCRQAGGHGVEAFDRVGKIEIDAQACLAHSATFDIDAEASKFIGSTRTRELIVDTSLEYLRRLSAEAKRDPDLALDVGNAYMRVARVQGVPTQANLGQLDQADQSLRIIHDHSIVTGQGEFVAAA